MPSRVGHDLDGGCERGRLPTHRTAQAAPGGVAGLSRRRGPAWPALENPTPRRVGQWPTVHLGRRRDQCHGSSVGRCQSFRTVTASLRRPSQGPHGRRLHRARRLAPTRHTEMSTALGERGWVICGLSCDFVGRGSGLLLDRGAPVLTVADPCIWHGSGTNLSRRQPATTAGAPTSQACVLRCTPTGLHHVASAVDQSKPRRPARAGGA